MTVSVLYIYIYGGSARKSCYRFYFYYSMENQFCIYNTCDTNLKYEHNCTMFIVVYITIKYAYNKIVFHLRHSCKTQVVKIAH